MKKNRFLTFLFSLIPGCGLMYLGYMKKGLQVMLMFTAAAFMCWFFSPYNIGWLMGFFLLLLPIIWFYQMFDAMHTVVRMRAQGIEMPTDDGFYLPDNMAQFSPLKNRAIAKVAAAILIIAGSFTLILGVLNSLLQIPWISENWNANYMFIIIRNNMIPVVVSIILIIAGIRLLKGKGGGKGSDAYDKDAR